MSPGKSLPTPPAWYNLFSHLRPKAQAGILFCCGARLPPLCLPVMRCGLLLEGAIPRCSWAPEHRLACSVVSWAASIVSACHALLPFCWKVHFLVQYRNATSVKNTSQLNFCLPATAGLVVTSAHDAAGFWTAVHPQKAHVICQ